MKTRIVNLTPPERTAFRLGRRGAGERTFRFVLFGGEPGHGVTFACWLAGRNRRHLTWTRDDAREMIYLARLAQELPRERAVRA